MMNALVFGCKKATLCTYILIKLFLSLEKNNISSCYWKCWATTNWFTVDHHASLLPVACASSVWKPAQYLPNTSQSHWPYSNISFFLHYCILEPQMRRSHLEGQQDAGRPLVVFSFYPGWCYTTASCDPPTSWSADSVVRVRFWNSDALQSINLQLLNLQPDIMRMKKIAMGRSLVWPFCGRLFPGTYHSNRRKKYFPFSRCCALPCCCFSSTFQLLYVVKKWGALSKQNRLQMYIGAQWYACF